MRTLRVVEDRGMSVAVPQRAAEVMPFVFEQDVWFQTKPATDSV